MKRILNLLHGESPKIINLFLMYLTGFLGALSLFYYYHPSNSTVGNLVLVIIGFDIIGGVAANMTDSTKTWWQRKPKHVQYLFLLGHINQPLLLVFFCGANLQLMLLLYFYVLIIGILLINLEEELNRIIALLATTVGIVLFVQFSDNSNFNWFIVAYILKLTIGFSIKTKPVTQLENNEL